MGSMDFGRNDMQMNQGFGNSFGTMGTCWFVPDYLTIIPSSITVAAYIIGPVFLAVYYNWMLLPLLSILIGCVFCCVF